jgi:AcrR family transcriptional regulator
MPQVKQDQESMRGQILDSARERFTRYGFGKTTMVEIAKDCSMSAANLYRYFENKHDIGAAMACQCLSEKALYLRQVVEDGQHPASDKIKLFVLTSLRYTHERWSSQPHMSELVDAVTESRQDIVNQHLAQTRAMLKRIIDEGVANNEFEVDDSAESAEAVLAAMFIFDYPNMMGLHPLKVFEEKAVLVAELIVHGLKKC